MGREQRMLGNEQRMLGKEQSLVQGRLILSIDGGQNVILSALEYLVWNLLAVYCLEHSHLKGWKTIITQKMSKGAKSDQKRSLVVICP